MVRRNDARTSFVYTIVPLRPNARPVSVLNMMGIVERYLSERRAKCAAPCDSTLGLGEEPPLGSHLVTPRAFYTHHGIYAGDGRVIHYAGLTCSVRRGPVEETSLQCFADRRDIFVRGDGCFYSRREVVERARSRLGECQYTILTNNCEHFCAWARRNESRIRQIERLLCRGIEAWTDLGQLHGFEIDAVKVVGRIGARPHLVINQGRRWVGEADLAERVLLIFRDLPDLDEFQRLAIELGEACALGRGEDALELVLLEFLSGIVESSPNGNKGDGSHISRN